MTEKEKFLFDHGYAHAKRELSKVIEDIKAEIGTLCDNIDCWNCIFRDKTLSDKKVLTYCKLGQIFDKHLCEVKE